MRLVSPLTPPLYLATVEHASISANKIGGVYAVATIKVILCAN